MTGIGVVWLKCQTALLTKIQHYFLNKRSLDCCKPFVNLQSSEKVDSDNFCQYFLVEQLLLLLHL